MRERLNARVCYALPRRIRSCEIDADDIEEPESQDCEPRKIVRPLHSHHDSHSNGGMNFEAFMNRNKLGWFVVVPLALHLAVAPVRSADEFRHSPASSRPDLEYLKAVNESGPPKDPQL